MIGCQLKSNFLEELQFSRDCCGLLRSHPARAGFVLFCFSIAAHIARGLITRRPTAQAKFCRSSRRVTSRLTQLPAIINLRRSPFLAPFGFRLLSLSAQLLVVLQLPPSSACFSRRIPADQWTVNGNIAEMMALCAVFRLHVVRR